MPTHVNLVVQLAAVAGVVVLRLLNPGLVFVIFFIFVPVGTAALIVQIVLAASAMRRHRLHLGSSFGFLVLAASGLGAAALMPETNDRPGSSENSPLGLLLGAEPAQSWVLAMALLVVWVITAVGVAVALAVTHRPAPARPTFPMPVCAPLPYGR